ncbi:HEPN domain-containing protein [Nonomuraea muscovyensis]|uniref:HEPN domain-containing protein n=1 Tax=Nonomuraea muscovyensis TaxID=1124761 RepID=UPI0033E87B05
MVLLVKKFREFGASLIPDEIRDESVVWKEAMALKDFAPSLRTDLPILSGSMLLYVCGRFEYFVRQEVECICDELARCVSRYSELPEVLREELRKRTLEVAKTPSRYRVDTKQAEQLLIALGRNLDGSGKTDGAVSVASSILSMTESNLKPDALQEVMKRVGMAEIWKDLGKQAKLKSFLQKSEDSDCTATAKAKLNNIMDMRNQIAHPTAGMSFPDPDGVIWIAGYLGVLGVVLTELSESYLGKFTGSLTSPGIDPFI